MQMNMTFLSELIVLVGSIVGLTYGTVVFLANKTPLYAKMITGAIGCMMFGYLLAVIRRITGFEEQPFQLDYLTYIGVFLFFLTANVGIMDGLADDRSQQFRKYRLFSLAAPLVIALLYVPIAMSDMPTVTKVFCGIVAVFAAAASYFNFKHVIFPDVDFGVIHCVRGYNRLALAYAVLHMGTMAARAWGADTVTLILSILTCADVILILPMLKRGIERWKTA